MSSLDWSVVFCMGCACFSAIVFIITDCAITYKRAKEKQVCKRRELI